MALAMLIVIPAQMWFGAVLGTGDVKAAVGIAYLTAISLAWPVDLVWLSLPIAWSVCLLISYLWQRLQI